MLLGPATSKETSRTTRTPLSRSSEFISCVYYSSRNSRLLQRHCGESERGPDGELACQAFAFLFGILPSCSSLLEAENMYVTSEQLLRAERDQRKRKQVRYSSKWWILSSSMSV
ncbi:hypothetical protein K402DRAFT_158523 [Aulographum hederae CBS 113979]|uniref:Uncharacterized protein n=1 Tax=Aulographum hederae CBS 113979 TaxID=1176131 RepID=A0A6G1GSG4_9PEZI|nr:hypothetical protein K402DRAFT_158523 [Aulographum hederae CBS 113979]